MGHTKKKGWSDYNYLCLERINQELWRKGGYFWERGYSFGAVMNLVELGIRKWNVIPIRKILIKMISFRFNRRSFGSREEFRENNLHVSTGRNHIHSRRLVFIGMTWIEKS